MRTTDDGPELVTPVEAVATALQRHRDGRLAEARILYGRVLAVEPDNPEALHFLGLLLHQLGSRKEAIDHLRRAVAAAPDYADALSNLGNMLLEQGDLAAAEAAYRRALALASGLVDARNNLGLLLHRRGRPEAAEQTYREAIAQAPGHPLAYNNLGRLLAEAGRLDEAIALLARAVELDPEFVEAFRNLGRALAARGRPEAAAQAYRRAVKLGADAYLELATALRDQGLIDEAIGAYREVLAVGGRQPTAFHSLGMLLCARQREPEAIDVYQRWLAWDPGNPVARHLLAAARQDSPPPRAPDDFVEAVFDGFAPVFDQRLSDLEYRAPQLVAAALEREFGGGAKARILDAGCGTGLCAPLLRPLASRLVGVDLSAAMLEVARGRGDYDALIKAELTAFLQAAEGDFDIIASADTLVYFGDLKPVLLAARHALRPGGGLVATFERLGDEAGTGYVLNAHGRYGHGEGYLRALCGECGFCSRSLVTEVLRQEMGRPVAGLVLCARRDR